MVVYAWGLFDQNISHNHIVKPGHTLCYAARWYGEKEIHFDSIHKTSRKRMLKSLHLLLDEADAVVSYNGTNFDIPTVNKEFLLSRMLPPAPYKQIDLLQTARKVFRFPSNKLDYIAKALDHGQKVKHRGMDLWTDCMAGKDAAWKEMEAYNKHDVVLLEEVYEDMLPWIRQHPNHGLYGAGDRPVCPNCESPKLQRRGYSVKASRRYPRFQCMGCGKWSSGTKAESATKLHLSGTA